VGHKLDVLKRHCEAVGRDYDDIFKTVYYRFDTSTGAEKIVHDLRRFADMGFQAAIGEVLDVWSIAPLELIGAEVIPVLAEY
jgi:hypothetical protein